VRVRAYCTSSVPQATCEKGCPSQQLCRHRCRLAVMRATILGESMECPLGHPFGHVSRTVRRTEIEIEIEIEKDSADLDRDSSAGGTRRDNIDRI
jgi:hypothetical protein